MFASGDKGRANYVWKERRVWESSDIAKFGADSLNFHWFKELHDIFSIELVSIGVKRANIACHNLLALSDYSLMLKKFMHCGQRYYDKLSRIAHSKFISIITIASSNTQEILKILINRWILCNWIIGISNQSISNVSIQRHSLFD